MENKLLSWINLQVHFSTQFLNSNIHGSSDDLSLSTEFSSVAMDIVILILSFIVYSESLLYLCVKIAHFSCIMAID